MKEKSKNVLIFIKYYDSKKKNIKKYIFKL